MKKLKVLQLTDAKGHEQSYYSEQLEALMGDKHITETDYFLTENNIVIDIDKDIDKKDIHIKESIEMGAVIKNIFYVEDGRFSDHIYKFNSKGLFDCVEHAEEHGVIFLNETDAKKYEKYIKMLEVKDEFLDEIKAIEEISCCKKMGKVVAPKFTHYLSNGEDDVLEISESKINKVYKKSIICPLGLGYLISANEWQWLEENNEEGVDVIYIRASDNDDKLEEICDYTIEDDEVGGSCSNIIYIKELK